MRRAGTAAVLTGVVGGAIAVIACGGPPVAPTAPALAVPAGSQAAVLHGKVHEANGGPLAKVFVGPPGTTSGGIALTDASGGYQVQVSRLPRSGSGAGALTFSQAGYARSVLLLTPPVLSTGEAGDVSLERLRHVSAGRPIAFSITDDDARLGVSTLNEYICDPCAAIAIDDMPADGVRLHVEWDDPSALLAAFLEATDADDLPIRLGMTSPVADVTCADITIPAGSSALWKTQPLLKVGFWTFVHTHLAAPVAVRVSVSAPAGSGG